MVGRRKGESKEFRELDFAEQAESITATIDDLQMAIDHHVDHSPHPMETIETCLAQVDRLGLRLREAYPQQGSQAGSGLEPLAVGDLHRLCVGSPRLARPEQAADFAMEVGEDSRDAGLR